jgi:tripartite-type tricarboxylate transporter receptor subunit TctC
LSKAKTIAPARSADQMMPMSGDTISGATGPRFDGAGLKSNTGLGMRGLAVCAKVRSASFPDVPTMEEGGVPIEIIGYHSAYVLAGTPPAAMAALREALRKAEGTKAVRDFIASTGNEIMNLSGDAFGAWERGEFDKWGKAARDSGLAGTL